MQLKRVRSNISTIMKSIKYDQSMMTRDVTAHPLTNFKTQSYINHF